MFKQLLTGWLDKTIAQFNGNDAGNAPVLLTLGGFKFSLNTAVFQERQRRTAYRWSAQERVGRESALQFTGLGDDVVTLPGVIYPEFRGGLNQIGNLRTLGLGGKPLRMISAGGIDLGDWVIDEIEDTQAYFNEDGSFKKQTFTITLRRYVK